MRRLPIDDREERRGIEVRDDNERPMWVPHLEPDTGEIVYHWLNDPCSICAAEGHARSLALLAALIDAINIVWIHVATVERAERTSISPYRGDGEDLRELLRKAEQELKKTRQDLRASNKLLSDSERESDELDSFRRERTRIRRTWIFLCFTLCLHLVLLVTSMFALLRKL